MVLVRKGRAEVLSEEVMVSGLGACIYVMWQSELWRPGGGVCASVQGGA